MERRTCRVSEAQWGILLEFLEQNPNLARARGYNNSARGRAEATRLWREAADQLNAEGSGSFKTPKDWSVYVSNYKSKLKKIVAGISSDIGGTGGGPPRGSSLSDLESRFLALLGPGFGQTAPRVRVHPFPDEELQQPSTSAVPEGLDVAAEVDVQNEQIRDEWDVFDTEPITEVPTRATLADIAEPEAPPSLPLTLTRDEPPPPGSAAPPLPRRTRQPRYRSRPLAPLDEARRILSQVEMQRAAADASAAQALQLIGQNLGRIAEAMERYLNRPQ